MKRIEKTLALVLEGILALCLFAIFALVVTLVVLRYVFNSSITGANEIVTVLFIYTTSIGGALAAGRREHIAITVLVERLPARWLRFFDTLAMLLVAFINAVIVYYSVGWIQITGNYLMPSTGLPRVVAQISVPIGCGLAAVYCLFRAFAGRRAEPETLEP